MPEQKPDSAKKGPGSAQGAATQPGSTPPEQNEAATPANVQAIPIGSPFDPETMRAMKEAAETSESDTNPSSEASVGAQEDEEETDDKSGADQALRRR